MLGLQIEDPVDVLERLCAGSHTSCSVMNTGSTLMGRLQQCLHFIIVVA